MAGGGHIMELLIWLGILFCISQSAMFSGLNLAFFSISRLRLEVEASKQNRHAMKVLELRKDSNLLLTTVLWGNVGINVLLTLLSNSVLAGVMAFLFSTVLITLLGEIVPQAYFSRHALKAASLLSPVLRVYQILLFPVCKPTALLLDLWLGQESIPFFRERDFQELLKVHIDAGQSDIDKMEGQGALNFLTIDDLPVIEEGEPVDPESIVSLQFEAGRPQFPAFEQSHSDPFLRQIHRSNRKWMIVTDQHGKARLAMDSDSFLREALFEEGTFRPLAHCHRPIMIDDPTTTLGEVIYRLKVWPDRPGDDVIDEDIVLFWGKTRRIITGADILGRLLRGIAARADVAFSVSRSAGSR
jgi:hypothetical protein